MQNLDYKGNASLSICQDENVLIEIKTINDESAVSARELYNFLGLDQSNWSRWYQKNIIDSEFAFENTDYQTFVIEKNGNQTKDFVLSVDFAKRLSMMARTEKGEQARQYFIACEKELKAKSKPMTQMELILHSAQLLVDQERRTAVLEAQQHEMDVKLKMIEARVATRPDYFTIIGFATLHGLSLNLKQASAIGRKASSLCKKDNVETDTIPDARFGIVKMYPKYILDMVFDQYIVTA